MAESAFIFTVCQAGAEKALKQELEREHRELRFAYSRPGFVTFKRADGAPLGERFELRSVFARAYGLSLGKTTGPEGVAALARELGGSPERPLRLHVFERERHVPGDEPLGFRPGALASAARERILGDAGTSRLFAKGEPALDGELVLDVAVIEEGEWWLGAHRHSAAHSPYPGGNPRIPLPAEAPSRAYLKLEEGLLWSGLPVRAGDTAVEIGSAPGGAVYALLKRGVHVLGIDPGEMDRAVRGGGHGQARFSHLRKSAGAVERPELPEAQWLLLDMNFAPDLALREAERIAGMLQDSLLGVLLTLKLNEWQLAARIPEYLERVRKLGLTRVRATQLASDRREICVAGLTRKGSLRR